MSTQYKEVAQIARASLMPDFFAVRIDEEKLFDTMKELLAKISLPGATTQLDRIKQLAAASPNATAFIDGIKGANLWTPLREVLTKVKVP